MTAAIPLGVILLNGVGALTLGIVWAIETGRAANATQEKMDQVLRPTVQRGMDQSIRRKETAIRKAVSRLQRARRTSWPV